MALLTEETKRPIEFVVHYEYKTAQIFYQGYTLIYTQSFPCGEFDTQQNPPAFEVRLIIFKGEHGKAAEDFHADLSLENIEVGRQKYGENYRGVLAWGDELPNGGFVSLDAGVPEDFWYEDTGNHWLGGEAGWITMWRAAKPVLIQAGFSQYKTDHPDSEAPYYLPANFESPMSLHEASYSYT